MGRLVLSDAAAIADALKNLPDEVAKAIRDAAKETADAAGTSAHDPNVLTRGYAAAYQRRMQAFERQQRDEERAERDHQREMKRLRDAGRREQEQTEREAARRAAADRRAEARQLVRDQKQAEADGLELAKRAAAKERAQFQLRDRALSGVPGFGGFAARRANLHQLGGTMQTAGMGRLGRLVGGKSGGIAMVLEGGQRATELAAQYARLQQDPFLNDAQRAGRMAALVPGLETLSAGVRLFGGVDSRIRTMQEYGNPAALIGARGEAHAHHAGVELARYSEDIESRAKAYQRYGAVGLPTADRGTARGRQEYGEQVRLQGALQGVKKAEVELAAARDKRGKTSQRVASAEDEYNRAMEKSKQLTNNLNAEPKPSLWARAWGAIGVGAEADERITNLKGQADAAKADADAKREALKAARDDDHAARLGSVEADFQRRMAEQRVRRERLATAEGREAAAEGNAERLGGMGVGGRMQAQIAYDMLRRNPELADVAPDLARQAALIAPEEVRTIQRTIGARSAEFRQGVAEGRVGFEDIDAARGRTDELRGQVVQGDVDLEKDRVAAVARELEQMKVVFKQTVELIRQAAGEMQAELKRGIMGGRITIQF